MPRRLLPVLGLSLLCVSACRAQDSDFDTRVHDYLMRHPEVVQEALTKLQAKQDAQAADTARAAIAQNRKALEQDSRDFVANPNGAITVTQFFDYRCPHCINAAPAVLALIHDQPDVRVVFKEFPIFGDISDRAAAGALAVKRAGGDYLGAYKDLMAARPLDEGSLDAILKAHGVDPASLDQPQAKAAADQQLGDVRSLAITLGINGTPSFIVGDTLVPGEDMDAVKAAIAAQRKAKG